MTATHRQNSLYYDPILESFEKSYLFSRVVVFKCKKREVSRTAERMRTDLMLTEDTNEITITEGNELDLTNPENLSPKAIQDADVIDIDLIHAKAEPDINVQTPIHFPIPVPYSVHLYNVAELITKPMKVVYYLIPLIFALNRLFTQERL